MSLDALLDAALPHVAFDGWSEASFRAACQDSGIDEAEARALAPRGALDLAVAYHRRGDRAMLDRLAETDLTGMKFRDKVATALKFRLDAMEDREAVRRASTLFSLPTHAGEGGKLVWETADHVWTALGDESRDGNWYSKRAILSGIWASTVLYWLGDSSVGHADTQAFIDRRIENVMQFEKLKGQMRENPLTRPFMRMQDAVMEKMRAPQPRGDVPGAQV
ncbi:MAG: COQ9 family protein [Silicimonas sp.]|jgi:ubiquinone biosynthesis protein COQ9|nr:COQ9 family protein [Silicimonas sp.]